MERETRLFRGVTAALIVLYAATLVILGFAHFHLSLQSPTTQLGAAQDHTSSDLAPTCVVCFRLNSSQPNMPEQQIIPGRLPGTPATPAPASSPACIAAVTPTDGRAPPVSQG